MFGTARLYAGAGLVADVLARHPGVRVELVGQNSTDVQEDLRRGRIEAAMIAVPSVSSEGMSVTPVARDELVYISADPERLADPGHRAAAGAGVAGDARDHLARRRLDPDRAAPDAARDRPQPADPDRGRGRRDRRRAGRHGARRLGAPPRRRRAAAPRLAPGVGWVSLRPRQYETMAVVHRPDASFSPAARLMIELATERVQAICEPIGRRVRNAGLVDALPEVRRVRTVHGTGEPARATVRS